MPPSTPPHEQLRRLRRFVIGQKALETVAAALAGIYAGSVALAGFALLSGMDGARLFAWRDSANESSGNVLFTKRLLGFSALGFGGFVVLRSAYVTLAGAHPAHSLLGEALVECSIILTVMLFRIARRRIPSSHFAPKAVLKSVAVRLTLAVIVLGGLALNSVFGLWMADPLSALPIVGFFFFTGERFLKGWASNQAHHNLPAPGELIASIAAHVGAEHADRSQLRVIVCGGGRLGHQAVRSLEEAGHDVAIVEKDIERCRTLGQESSADIVYGDATAPEVLRRAGLERCDVVAALTGSGTTNDRICRAAEQAASVRSVMRTPFGAEAGSDSGAKGGIRMLGGLDGDLHILELRVALHAPIAGKRLSDVQMPRGGRVLSGASGESISTDQTVFAPGRSYVVAVPETAKQEAIRLFRGRQKAFN